MDGLMRFIGIYLLVNCYKLLHNHGKSPFLMGRSTKWASFNSYVSLPEGKWHTLEGFVISEGKTQFSSMGYDGILQSIQRWFMAISSMTRWSTWILFTQGHAIHGLDHDYWTKWDVFIIFCFTLQAVHNGFDICIYIYYTRQMPGLCPEPQLQQATHHRHHQTLVEDLQWM